jgi:hypothetical protein
MYCFRPTLLLCLPLCRLMCKSELFLKIAAANLVTLNMSPADSAALLACYQRKCRPVQAICDCLHSRLHLLVTLFGATITTARS